MKASPKVTSDALAEGFLLLVTANAVNPAAGAIAAAFIAVGTLAGTGAVPLAFVALALFL